MATSSQQSNHALSSSWNRNQVPVFREPQNQKRENVLEKSEHTRTNTTGKRPLHRWYHLLNYDCMVSDVWSKRFYTEFLKHVWFYTAYPIMYFLEFMHGVHVSNTAQLMILFESISVFSYIRRVVILHGISILFSLALSWTKNRPNQCCVALNCLS